MINYPKTVGVESKMYLGFVRKLPCYFCGAEGQSDPHHFPFKSRGVTNDHDVVPACRVCHEKCHAYKISAEEQSAGVKHTQRQFRLRASDSEWSQYNKEVARMKQQQWAKIDF
jgi:hypothetical protein